MNKYHFLKVFDPEKNMVKEFEHWMVLTREGQVTLGDCIIVLKRQIKRFGEMTAEESAELYKVMSWYENKCIVLFGAEKFNYIAAMMRDDFVHFHAFPRYSKNISKYDMEWKDERWPRVIQFSDSQCDYNIYQLITNDMKE